MAKILLIISALVIAATAYLGFATKQKVDLLQGDLKGTKTTLIATQGELSKTKGTLKKTEDELVAAKATIDEKEKDIAAKKGEIDKLTANLTKTEGELKEKSDQLAEVKAQMEKINQPGVSVEEIGAKMAELGKAKADLEQQVAELKQVKETLTKQRDDEQAKAATAQTQVAQYKAEYTKPGVTGTVLAYNPGWNFVVLSIGDKQSLKAGKVLVVTRGGQMVARVRVTSVEPSTSIADVIPNSIARGESVQPGDSVVYEGRAK